MGAIRIQPALNADPNALSAGEGTFARELAQEFATAGSGILYLTFFTARKSEQVGNVRVITHGTAAAATPTLCRLGVYSVAANGDLALLGATANDTTLFAAGNTAYTRAVTVPFQKVAGQRYAVGRLVVSAAATPSFAGAGSNALGGEFALAPRVAGLVTGQTDLPASVAAASLGAFPVAYYAAVTP